MANMIARLGVLLGLDGAEFERGIQRAERSLKKFAEDAVTYGSIAATAMTGAALAAAQMADDIDDLAKANEVTIDTILRLNNALELNGGQSENAAKMLSSFSNFVDKAAGGSKEAQERLSKLGISLDELANLPVDQLFARTAQALSEIEDPITRNASAFEVFGKSVKGLDLKNFADDLNSASVVTDRQAAGIRDLADAHEMLARSARQLGVTLMGELGGPFKTLLEYLEKLKGSGEFFRELLRDIIHYATGTLGTLASWAKSVYIELEAQAKAIKALFTGNFADINKIFEEAQRKQLQNFEQYKKFVSDLEQASYGEKSAPSSNSTAGRLVVSAEELERQKQFQKLLEQQRRDAERRAEQEQRELEKYLEMLQRNADAMEKMQRDEEMRLDALMQITEVESQIGVLTQEEIARRKELIQLTYEHERAINRINETLMDNDAKQRALLKEDQIHATKLALSEQRLANTQAANANSLRISQNLQRDRLELEKEMLLVDANFGRKRAEEVTHARELMQIEFDRKKAIDEINRMNLSGAEKQAAIQRENENAASRAELANTKLEIARAKREGTFMEGFKNKMFDAVRDLPTELERGEQFFESVMSNMENALSNFIKTGKLNFKDFARSIIQDLLMIQMRAQMVSIFKSFLGDYDPAQASGVAKFFSGLAGRADGGPISANTPYLVGERGPELVVPRSAGVVIPNQRMSGVGGVSNVTNNYIQAIDTKSFEERIYGSASAVWAANQFASRAMPTAPGRI